VKSLFSEKNIDRQARNKVFDILYLKGSFPEILDGMEKGTDFIVTFTGGYRMPYTSY